MSIPFVKIAVSLGWEVLMLYNPLDLFHNYVEEAVTHYLDLIRGDHPEAFTRSRKVSLSKLLFQMVDRLVGSEMCIRDRVEYFENSLRELWSEFF